MSLSSRENYCDCADSELIQLTLNGDIAAFDEIVRKYQQTLAGCLYRFSANHGDLEDMVQDAFVRAYQKLHLWKPSGEFIHWLKRIAYNTGYDYLRKRSRNPLSQTKEPINEMDDTQPDYKDERVETDQEISDKDLVSWLLKQLSAEEAMIITMQYIEQMSLQDIADSLGWGLSKVKVKAFRSRNKLKTLFEKHERFELQYSPSLG